ncbi:MAG TPA: hypothetical protein DCL21_07145 [Alphaproteobacteria bacterium]|nr:hypothetical protein [Alphaproteobacteria bacterium]
MTELEKREIKSRRMVVIWIVSFFGTIFAMNAFMITRASQTFNGVVAKKSYQQGIDYNKTLDARKQIVEEGLSQDLIIDIKDLALDLNLKLAHTSKNYKMPESVIISVERPTNEGQDFKLELLKKFNYKKSLELQEFQRGVWNIKYTLSTLDNIQVEFKSRIIVK